MSSDQKLYCRDCRFWDEWIDEAYASFDSSPTSNKADWVAAGNKRQGNCRINPPSVVVVSDNPGGVFPGVEEDDWCSRLETLDGGGQ